MLGSSRRYIFTGPEIFATFFALLAVSLAAYGVLWIADFAGDEHGHTPWKLIIEPDAVQTLTNLGDITIAILSLALTVVTIIVELASNRYTPRITELFIRDPINALMMGFYTCTAVLVLWVQMSLFSGHYPVWMVAASLTAMTIALLSLLPYFGYVFDFLMPTRVVQRISQRSANAIRSVTRRGVPAIAPARVEVLTAIEQLGDMALNSVDSKDKGITIAAITALSDMVEANIKFKGGLPVEWFDTAVLVQGDQDFIAMHPDVVRALDARRTWVEMKVFRHFQAAFEESLLKMRDIAHFIAIVVRNLAIKAAKERDAEGVRIAVRFLNTFMRATLNAHDQKTAYNLMNEFRTLAEAMLEMDRTDDVVEIGQRCKFYGQLAFRMKLPFILETTAYDLCTLLEKAHATHAPAHDPLLLIFLDVDRAPEDQASEASLRGVRKAQTKLATWYLLHGDEKNARRIHDDMRHEPPTRLRSIRAELLGVQEAEFWEVSDRGGNFDYLPPERRVLLETFFGWFDLDPHPG
jgi:hypothetical protein